MKLYYLIILITVLSCTANKKQSSTELQPTANKSEANVFGQYAKELQEASALYLASNPPKEQAAIKSTAEALQKAPTKDVEKNLADPKKQEEQSSFREKLKDPDYAKQVGVFLYFTGLSLIGLSLFAFVADDFNPSLEEVNKAYGKVQVNDATDGGKATSIIWAIEDMEDNLKQLGTKVDKQRNLFVLLDDYQIEALKKAKSHTVYEVSKRDGSFAYITTTKPSERLFKKAKPIDGAQFFKTNAEIEKMSPDEVAEWSKRAVSLSETRWDSDLYRIAWQYEAKVKYIADNGYAKYKALVNNPKVKELHKALYATEFLKLQILKIDDYKKTYKDYFNEGLFKVGKDGKLIFGQPTKGKNITHDNFIKFLATNGLKPGKAEDQVINQLKTNQTYLDSFEKKYSRRLTNDDFKGYLDYQALSTKSRNPQLNDFRSVAAVGGVSLGALSFYVGTALIITALSERDAQEQQEQQEEESGMKLTQGSTPMQKYLKTVESIARKVHQEHLFLGNIN